MKNIDAGNDDPICALCFDCGAWIMDPEGEPDHAGECDRAPVGM